MNHEIQTTGEDSPKLIEGREYHLIKGKDKVTLNAILLTSDNRSENVQIHHGEFTYLGPDETLNEEDGLQYQKFQPTIRTVVANLVIHPREDMIGINNRALDIVTHPTHIEANQISVPTTELSKLEPVA